MKRIVGIVSYHDNEMRLPTGQTLMTKRNQRTSDMSREETLPIIKTPTSCPTLVAEFDLKMQSSGEWV